MPSAPSALTATRSPRRSAGFHVTGVAGDATLSSRCAVSRLRSLAPGVRTARRLRRHRCTHAVRLAALAPSGILPKVVPFPIAIDMCCPRHGPPSTARVAEDPLRASPAPLGDAGLPPSSGPVRPASFTSPVRAADASAGAFGNVLRTCAVSAFSSDHHSIAIAAVVTLSNPAAPVRLFSTACLAAFGSIAALMPSASLCSSSAHPSASASPVPAPHVTGFRTPPSSLSSPLRTPLPALPVACSARLPEAPSTLTSTQSPWRLPSAGFAGVVPPSLIPQTFRS